MTTLFYLFILTMKFVLYNQFSTTSLLTSYSFPLNYKKKELQSEFVSRAQRNHNDITPLILYIQQNQIMSLLGEAKIIRQSIHPFLLSYMPSDSMTQNSSAMAFTKHALHYHHTTTRLLQDTLQHLVDHSGFQLLAIDSGPPERTLRRPSVLKATRQSSKPTNSNLTSDTQSNKSEIQTKMGKGKKLWNPFSVHKSSVSSFLSGFTRFQLKSPNLPIFSPPVNLSNVPEEGSNSSDSSGHSSDSDHESPLDAKQFGSIGRKSVQSNKKQRHSISHGKKRKSMASHDSHFGNDIHSSKCWSLVSRGKHDKCTLSQQYIGEMSGPVIVKEPLLCIGNETLQLHRISVCLLKIEGDCAFFLELNIEGHSIVYTLRSANKFVDENIHPLPLPTPYNSKIIIRSAQNRRNLLKSSTKEPNPTPSEALMSTLESRSDKTSHQFHSKIDSPTSSLPTMQPNRASTKSVQSSKDFLSKTSAQDFTLLSTPKSSSPANQSELERFQTKTLPKSNPIVHKEIENQLPEQNTKQVKLVEQHTEAVIPIESEMKQLLSFSFEPFLLDFMTHFVATCVLGVNMQSISLDIRLFMSLIEQEYNNGRQFAHKKSCVRVCTVNKPWYPQDPTLKAVLPDGGIPLVNLMRFIAYHPLYGACAYRQEDHQNILSPQSKSTSNSSKVQKEHSEGQPQALIAATVLTPLQSSSPCFVYEEGDDISSIVEFRSSPTSNNQIDLEQRGQWDWLDSRIGQLLDSQTQNHKLDECSQVNSSQELRFENPQGIVDAKRLINGKIDSGVLILVILPIGSHRASFSSIPPCFSGQTAFLPVQAHQKDSLSVSDPKSTVQYTLVIVLYERGRPVYACDLKSYSNIENKEVGSESKKNHEFGSMSVLLDKLRTVAMKNVDQWIDSLLSMGTESYLREDLWRQLHTKSKKRLPIQNLAWLIPKLKLYDISRWDPDLYKLTCLNLPWTRLLTDLTWSYSDAIQSFHVPKGFHIRFPKHFAISPHISRGTIHHLSENSYFVCAQDNEELLYFIMSSHSTEIAFLLRLRIQPLQESLSPGWHERIHRSHKIHRPDSSSSMQVNEPSGGFFSWIFGSRQPEKSILESLNRQTSTQEAVANRRYVPVRDPSPEYIQVWKEVLSSPWRQSAPEIRRVGPVSHETLRQPTFVSTVSARQNIVQARIHEHEAGPGKIPLSEHKCVHPYVAIDPAITIYLCSPSGVNLDSLKVRKSINELIKQILHWCWHHITNR